MSNSLYPIQGRMCTDFILILSLSILFVSNTNNIETLKETSTCKNTGQKSISLAKQCEEVESNFFRELRNV